MLGLSPSDYVLRALSSVHTNDLEQTLMVSDYFEDLFFLIRKVDFFFSVITF